MKQKTLRPVELVEVPIAEIKSISYQTKWAIFPMIFGGLLVALIAFIFSSDVESGTRVPVGALALALIFGFVLLRGPKRHRLTFLVGDKKLKWQSKAGDYKYKIAATQKVVAFARERGILSA